MDVLYLITDGKGNYVRYDIRSNKYVLVRNKFLAEKWEDRSKAQNILNSSIPKKLKKKFRVRETKDDRTPAEKSKSEEGVRGNPPPTTHQSTTVPVKEADASKAGTEKEGNKKPAHKKESSDQNITTNIAVSVSYPTIDSGNLEKIKANIRVMTEFAHDKDQRVEYLIEQLTQVDRELSDIAHYMEFNRLDGYRGYKAYKMFHDRRIRRRIIKDELGVLQGLGKCQLDSAMLTEVRMAAENIGERKYRPRAMPELFST